jgi:3-oxoacyl-[acyl-carrier protein] reductase
MSHPLGEVTPEEFDIVYNTNVKGLIFVTQAVIPHMPRGGRIINFSSVAARGGYATHTVYGSSKVAVEALTRTWATELGPRGITVNAVNPGPVETELFRKAGDLIIAHMEEASKKIPGGRIADVDDIAEIVVFLASEGSRWVTGDVVSSNGGMMYL